MAFEHKPNSGSIFPNDYKERDTQPDWTGSAMINGEEYRLAAWNNEGRNKDYISIKFELKSEYDKRVGQRADRHEGGRSRGGFSESQQAAIDKARAKAKEIGRQRSMLDSMEEDDIPF